MRWATFRFSVDSTGFQNYYRDLAKLAKAKEIDLLIVVCIFLTLEQATIDAIILSYFFITSRYLTPTPPTTRQ